MNATKAVMRTAATAAEVTAMATRLTDVRAVGCTIGFHISFTAQPVLTGC
ncbi:hypothetical protein ACFV8T_30105 [Streptomyces sp. NPDC059832]